MSKGVFINKLNTYIGTALYDEFLGEKPEESEWELYSTYYEKEESIKPLFIKKMMKQKSKPGLFRKYMIEKFDIMIYDMYSGGLEDLKFCIKSLTKAPLETEKTVIVISSVLSWANTPHKIVVDKPEPKEDDEDIEKKQDDPELDEKLKEEQLKLEEYLSNIDNIDQDGNEIEVKDEEGNAMEKENETYPIRLRQLKQEIIDNKKKEYELSQIKYKRVGYEEEEFDKRIPDICYKEVKEYEDELLKLKFENLNIFIVCAGLPYGNAQTIFNYHFKSAWLQNPEELPYLNEGSNIIPTIHVKDLTKIVKLIIDKKPENKYVFAFDRTIKNQSKDLVSSISTKIGTGKTLSLQRNEDYVKNLNFNTKVDSYINPEKYQDKKLNLILTDNELNWQGYFHIDVMLSPSKLYEPEEFEWYCKDFNLSINKVMKEFSKYRNLKPLKIIINCENQYERCIYAEKLASFYNVPIVNTNNILNMLSLNKEYMTEEEVIMHNKYFKHIEKLENLKLNGNDPSDPTLDEDEILFDTLKTILNDNACIYRGYILEGVPTTIREIQNLYYQKIEIKANEEDELPDDQDQVEEDQEDDEIKEDINNDEIKQNDEIKEPKNDDMSMDDQPQIMSNKSNNEDIISNMDENIIEKTEETKKKEESSLFIDKQDQIDEEEKQALAQLELEAKKKKKKEKPKRIRVKKFRKVFLKKLLPESVISIGFRNDNIDNISNNDTLLEDEAGHLTEVKISNPFLEVESFYQSNNIEILNIIANKNQDENLETMRIYIERNGRPFNYFKENEDKINENRFKLLTKKFDERKAKIDQKEQKQTEKKEQENKEYWAKMEKRISDIRKDKDEILRNNDKTRKFLLLNIMPILTKGMLEICKVDPIDPIDYLANYLFENSTA